MNAVIDLTGAIGLAEAARLMHGKGGKPPSVVTVRRWANPKRGYRPRNHPGPALVLHTVWLNNELVTLPEWVRAFEDARLRAGDRQQAAPLARPPVRREKAHARAASALAKDGIGARKGGEE